MLDSVISPENNLESSRFVDSEICRSVLISKGMSSDDDGFFPSWNESGNVLDDDGFSEDSAIEYISDGSIRALPHLLELELLDSRLIGRDGGALDSNFTLFDGLCGLDGDLVVGGIAVLDAEIEIEDVEIEEG